MKYNTVLIFLCYAAIVSAAGFKSRIANHGELAKKKEFPYIVSLKYNNKHLCGGSLISKNHVLTAAHCVTYFFDEAKYAMEFISVEAGMIRQGTGKTYNVKRISYHPEYKSSIVFQNDLSVVHLAEPIQLSGEISIANLPKAGLSLLPGTQVFVSGFGKEEISGPTSPVLKMMDAKTVSLGVCQKYLESLLVLGNICAVKGKDYGSCEGDSGGPLVDQSKTTLVGVVSGGTEDCKSGAPNVFIEVSRFLPYIESELDFDLKNPGTAAKNPAIMDRHLIDSDEEY